MAGRGAVLDRKKGDEEEERGEEGKKEEDVCQTSNTYELGTDTHHLNLFFFPIRIQTAFNSQRMV